MARSGIKLFFSVEKKIKRINRRLDYLLSYDYDIDYKEGKYHHLPDAISRNVPENINVIRIPIVKHQVKFKCSEIFSKKKNIHDELFKESRRHGIYNYLKGVVVDKTPPRSLRNSFFVENDCIYYIGKNVEENNMVKKLCFKLFIMPKKEAKTQI